MIRSAMLPFQPQPIAILPLAVARFAADAASRSPRGDSSSDRPSAPPRRRSSAAKRSRLRSSRLAYSDSHPIVPERLEQRAAAPAEQEHIARERIAAQPLLHQQRHSRHAAAHVRMPRRQPILTLLAIGIMRPRRSTRGAERPKRRRYPRGSGARCPTRSQ